MRSERSTRLGATLWVGIAVCGLLAGCAAPAAAPRGDALAGTHWRLVEIRSMDDTQGSTRPDDAARYTLALGADGQAALRLDCNRARGPWSAMLVADGREGSFRIGPLGVTRALCPPPSLGERIARDMENVRGFLLRDGRLHLMLMADAGIYVWAPDPLPGSR